MRRSDREVTDTEQIEQFISKEHIIRVAFYDEGDIYVVPLNYGYERNDGSYVFYFHGAKAGRKYELSKAAPHVGFEIDGKYELIEGEKACNYSAKFQSVIGTGTMYIVEDAEEKMKGLKALMRQTAGNREVEFSDAMVNAVAVFRLEVDKLSCKAK